MKLNRLVDVLLAMVILVACTSCKDFPGADGRYATHDRGASNREGGHGLPVTPYQPR